MMRLVESGVYLKKPSFDYMLSLAEPRNKVSESIYPDPAVRYFLMHKARVPLRPQESAGSVDLLRSKSRYCK